MKIDLKIDSDRLIARTLREQKRMLYNVAEAINKSGVAAQAKIREEMAKDFHLRTANKKGRKWLLDRIKFKFASVKRGTMWAEIYVDKKQRLLLAKFENGGTREPFVGKNVAVPNPEAARAGGSVEGEVKQELTFRKLGLRPHKVNPITRPDTVQFKGKERAFLLKSTAKNPAGGVYQRTGPGKDDIRLVYSFRRAFQLRKMLNIVKTAKAVFLDKFRVELAIAFARRGGSK